MKIALLSPPPPLFAPPCHFSFHFCANRETELPQFLVLPLSYAIPHLTTENFGPRRSLIGAKAKGKMAVGTKSGRSSKTERESGQGGQKVLGGGEVIFSYQLY